MSDLIPSRREADTPHTVLVVDDNQGVREMLATMLENLGYQVLAVSSSDEALILIDTEDIDGFSLISIWAATPAGSICAVR